MLLNIENLTKEYQINKKEKIKVLKDINLSFNYGELVAIVGESGSGKSTLLNLIGGLDKEYTGNIKINNKDLKKLDEKAISNYRKENIGFIFQSFNLIDHLSVKDNILLALKISRIPLNDKLDNILNDLGIKNLKNKKINLLSGGEKQRVAIARALIKKPDIILADEPTGALDSNNTLEIINILKKVAKQGKLVIVVTHSKKVAANCDRIIEINDGKIINDSKKNIKNNIISSNNYQHKKIKLISLIKLAQDNFKEKIKRNLLVSIGSSVGILSIILMLSISNGIKEYMTNGVKEFINPNIIEISKNGEYFNSNDIEKLISIKHVVKIEKNYLQVIEDGKIIIDNKDYPINLISTINSNVSTNILKGNIKDNNILVNDNLANQIRENILNKKVKLEIAINNKTININKNISGISLGTNINEIANNYYAIYFNYDDLVNILNINPNSIYIYSSDIKYNDYLKKGIVKLGYDIIDPLSVINSYLDSLSIITYVLLGVSAISIVVSMIMISIILYINVIERTKEIGILRALGLEKKKIKTLFVLESFIIGLMSGIISIINVYFVSFLANILSNKYFYISIVKVNVSYIIIGLLISITTSVLAGLYPANKATKLNPIESLRRE